MNRFSELDFLKNIQSQLIYVSMFLRKNRHFIYDSYGAQALGYTIYLEFDSGSGRTLAACLTHASRAEYGGLLLYLAADG